MDHQKYTDLTDEEAIKRIREIKLRLGRKLLFLAHNYQQRSIVELADFIGDSLELSRTAHREKQAEYIVFAGVRFMAETARILVEPNQRVFLPHPLAGCPMADMAKIEQAETAWSEVQRIIPGEVIPVTYVNSSAELKAFCGREGGVCVTSGNAKEVFQWAYKQKRVIFFFPDEYLGRNTADTLKISPEEQLLWDPNASKALGGLDPEKIKKSRIILWKGYCHVHTDFTIADIESARKEHPKAVIIVHPECRPEVVRAADQAGSTKFMQDYVAKAPKGAEIIFGTEVNHARNLAWRFPDKKITPLLTSAICPNMFKTQLKHVLSVLENLPDQNEVLVPASIQYEAKLALERMLKAV